jgi:PilZ domain
MHELRKFKRERSFLRGRIYFNNSRNAVDCLIQDISYEGARIVLSGSADVPDEVQLYIPGRKRLVLARVRWRRADDRVGLAFCEITSRCRLVRLSQRPPHGSLHRAVTGAVLEFSGGHERRRISCPRLVGTSGKSLAASRPR